MYKRSSNDEITRLINNQDYAKIICDKINTLEVNEQNDVLDELLTYCTENNLVEAYAWFLNEKGWIYNKKSNLVNAEEYHLKAYYIFESKNNINGILTAIIAILGCYCIQKRYDEYMQWLEKGIKIAEENNNIERLIAIKINATIVYMELKEFEKAIELMDEIERVAYFESRYNQVVIYINRASCEMELNNFEGALKYIENSYKIAEEYVPEVLFVVISNTADIYKKMKLYDKADEAYKKSIIINEENGIDIHRIETLLNWTDLDLIRGRYEVAIEKLKEIESIKEKNNADIDELKFNKLMNEAYKGIGDYEKAYYCLEKYVELQKEVKEDISLDKLNDIKEEQASKTYKLLYEQTESIYKVGKKITSKLNKSSIFKIIAHEISSLVYFDLFQIAVYNEETQKYNYQLVLENGEITNVDNEFVTENTFAAYCINNKNDILLSDIGNEYTKYIEGNIEYFKRILLGNNDEKMTQSCIFLPMILSDKVIGMISVQSYEKNKYSIKELATLKILSSYIAIALENSRLYKEVEYSARYDALTGVFNRREVLKKYYEIYNKEKINSGLLSIIMIDVDDFKKVNDVYGHQIGDNTLNLVAKTIKDSIRKDDIVGRYGGEEFIVIVDNEEIENAAEIAERIRMNVENLRVSVDKGNDIGVTLSIGVAESKKEEACANQLIKRADEALYRAKNSGKNKVNLG